MTDYIIRKLRKDDCPRLFPFLVENAETHGQTLSKNIEGLYVQSTAKVIYGREKLRKKEKPALEKEGFGENKRYECFVAEITTEGEDKEKLVGHCFFGMFYTATDGDSIFLDSFHVVEKYRKKGIATAMLKKMCQREDSFCTLSIKRLGLNP